MKRFLIFVLIMLMCMQAFPQVDTNKWIPPVPDHYSFIKYNDNKISDISGLDPVFRKLYVLRRARKGKVNIVHIGDSHLQADEITRVLRRGVQNYFGDGGRGLVFPYQLAGSNAPHDIHSSSNAVWEGNRLALKKAGIPNGISGFGIQSHNKDAAIRLRIVNEDGSPEYFNRMVFFLGREAATYRVTDSNIEFPQTFTTLAGIDTPSYALDTRYQMNGFELTRTEPAGQGDFCFYGVSLERNDTCGVIYHSIGVNGAHYEQYTESDLFWEQLAALHGDLFIISMGTNEAQSQHIVGADMVTVCDLFMQKLRKVAPEASVIITTPAGSYYRVRKPNAAMQTVSDALVHYCHEKKIPCWNLYEISGSKNSAVGWFHQGMFARDRVHFNDAGYRLQGQLLLQALANGYNDYKPPVLPFKGSGVVKKNILPGTTKAAMPAKPRVIASPVPKKDTLPPEPPRPHSSKIKISYEGDN